MNLLVCFYMNFIVLATSFIFTYRIFEVKPFSDGLVSWFIFYFAQIIFTELILGSRGILYISNVIFLNSALLCLFWFVSRKRESSFAAGIKNKLEAIFSRKPILLTACIILGFGLAKITVNLFNPPFGWDDLNYHFTFPVEWLKHGNLNNPITVFDDPGPTYYPINGNLYFLWLIFPFKSVFLADLGQVPFFILGFLSVYSLSRKLNITQENSYLAAALFTFIPNYFKQTEIAYVDVMVSALFLACANFLFLLDKEFTWKNVLIFAVALGSMLGIKTVALPYSALLFLPFIYLSFRKIKKWPLFAICIFFVVIFGGFSYIRNLMDTGNPLYPLDFNLFGRAIFKGVMNMDTYRAHFKIEDYRLSKLLFHEGLGIQSVVFIFPALFLGLPVALIKKRKEISPGLFYFLVLPFLIYLVYRYVIPLANTRYLYCLFGLGMVIAFYVIEELKIPPRIINVLVALCFLGAIAEISKRGELICSIALTVLLFFLLPVLIRDARFLPLIFVSSLCFLLFAERYYAKYEYPRYITMVEYSGFWPDAAKAWEWLNKNTKGDNIAYAGRPVPFPLYGSNFKNNVYYISVNKTEPAKLHYFSGSRYEWGYDFLSLHKNLEAEGNYRWGADYSLWLGNILKRNTGYLFVYSLHQTEDIEFPIEDKWAKANPDRFSSVFANETVHIYEVIK